ncbi:hypothetical protein [Glycomyces tarimensis]
MSNHPRIPRNARWWALGVAAVLALACSGPGGDDAGSSGDDAAAEESGDYFTEAYPTFEVAEFSGTGDDVVELPEGATDAMVTLTHDGSANFAVSALDENNESTGDLLVNTIGSYEGVTALGLIDLGNEPARLEVSADGSWAMTLAPFGEAAELPGSGTGDGVFRYEGDAATWGVTHDGESNFAVSYYTDADFEMPLLINEIGAYEGEQPVGAGPGLVVINADGSWTVAPQ